MRTLVAIVCIGILLALMHAAQEVVTPLLLGSTLAIAFQPMAVGLARRGLPPIVAAALTTLAVLALMCGAGLLIYSAGSNLAMQIPEYQARVEVVKGDLITWLHDHRLVSTARAVRQFDIAEPAADYAASSVLQMGGYLQTFFFVLVIAAFIQMEGAIYQRKLQKTFGRQSAGKLREALREVQRYLLVKLVVSAANGILLGVWCWLWGVDSPVLWGVVAFALNFIPYVGSLIASIPPIFLALVEGGWPAAIGVATGYVVVNLTVDNMLEPRIMGRALGLSPLIVLLSMLLWGFVLGPVGTILAVPLTMTAKILLAHDEDLAPIAVFLGDGSDLVATKR